MRKAHRSASSSAARSAFVHGQSSIDAVPAPANRRGCDLSRREFVRLEVAHALARRANVRIAVLEQPLLGNLSTAGATTTPRPFHAVSNDLSGGWPSFR